MRFDRDTILRPKDAEIERRHDGRERGGRSLMAADLQPVRALPYVVGVVDGPAREPQHFALQLAKDDEIILRNCFVHCRFRILDETAAKAAASLRPVTA